MGGGKKHLCSCEVEPHCEEGKIAVLDFVPLYAGQGLRLALAFEREHVHQVALDLGYVHTGLEKLAESLTYGQCVHLAARLGEESSLGGELGLMLALALFCRTGSRFTLRRFGESGRFCHQNPGGVIAPALGALVVPGARSRSGTDSALASVPALESD